MHHAEEAPALKGQPAIQLLCRANAWERINRARYETTEDEVLNCMSCMVVAGDGPVAECRYCGNTGIIENKVDLGLPAEIYCDCVHGKALQRNDD